MRSMGPCSSLPSGVGDLEVVPVPPTGRVGGTPQPPSAPIVFGPVEGPVSSGPDRKAPRRQSRQGTTIPTTVPWLERTREQDS
jgi:hypothetical protein